MTTEAKNRELLLLFFEPDEKPDPAKKEEFLKNVMAGQLSRTARITLDRMLLIQVKYIRKTAWLTALMILLAAALITKGSPDSVLQIAALTPLLAFVTEIETRRSYAYGMAELEMTTSFSLRSIRYARFMILGLFDLAILSGISLLIRKYVAMSAMLTLSCLLLPFLLTMTGALLLERTAFGRSHPHGSGVLALLISVGTEILLFPASPLAMPLNKTVIMLGLGTGGSLFAGCSDYTILHKCKTGSGDDNLMELKIDRVSKQYKNKIAVDRLSATLHTGVTGLLGANGAGKTTLMRMICGVITPTSGEITYNGIPVSEERYRSVLGYLPQEFGCYPEFSGRDFLLYFAALKGMPRNEAEIRSEELLETVGLADVSKKRVRTYSGGMKQRLGIAQALLNRPQVLILDEPTAGLDPMERVRFRELIGEIGKSSIVLLSTHIVSDVEHIADHILMMKNGQLLWQGEWKESDGSLEEFYLREFRE